ncbi:MAG: hypothetical protein P8K10_03460, partial [Crocinitomicaceae bacterium]|nr:hypothetical protein [Crocinitomicaceae bacterium]
MLNLSIGIIKVSHLYRIIVCCVLILFYSCEDRKTSTLKKEVDLHYRKYNTSGPYNNNPISGNRIKNSVNSKNELIKGENKIKIDGKRIDFRTLKQPKTYKLEAPKRINTRGIINIPLELNKVQKRMVDSSTFLKKAFGSSTINPAKTTNIKLRKVKTKIPSLADAKTPIYKGKAI